MFRNEKYDSTASMSSMVVQDVLEITVMFNEKTVLLLLDLNTILIDMDYILN